MSKKQRTSLLQFGLVVAVIRAIVLRFYGLGLQSFWIDESFSSYVSQLSMQAGTVFSYPYRMHTVSQIVAFKFFGISDFAARFPSVIFNILNMFVVYAIAQNLWKDKRVSRISVLLFAFSQREIVWARQARFYSLLELLFCINTLLLVIFTKNHKTLYLNALIMSTYLGVLFHPFLYSNVLFLVLIAIRYVWIHLRATGGNITRLIFPKYSSTLLLLGIIIVHQLLEHFVMPRTITTDLFIPSNLPWDMQQNYIKGYTSHLLEQLGVLLLFAGIGIGILAKQKKRNDVLLCGIGTIAIFAIISMRGYLMHFRYVLILYPLIFILASYSIVQIIKSQKEKLRQVLFALVMGRAVIMTGKYQLLPQVTYMIDYTSPQPDFKSAYTTIPNNQQVVSGFPTLCKWYYSNRGTCTAALQVDLVFDNAPQITVPTEFYTQIPYIDTLEVVTGKNYIVIDNLSEKGLHNNNNILVDLTTNYQIYYSNSTGYHEINVYIK